MTFWANVCLGIVAFACSNIDDFFILILFFSTSQFKAVSVVASQFLGIGIIAIASWAISLFTKMIPTPWIHFLGILPIVLGLQALWNRRKSSENDHSFTHKTGVASLTFVTLANSADNLAIYVPLFATHSQTEVILYNTVFFVMTAIWCWLSYYLAKRPKWKNPLRILSDFTFPWILIGLGIYILAL